MSGPDFFEDYEMLTVETPEGLPLRLPLAGFGPRFLAQVVDGLILGFVAFVLFIIMIAAVGFSPMAPGREEAMLWPMLLLILGVAFISFGYFVLFESLWNGQTVGKRLVGIRVVKRGGLPLSFTDVLIRNLVRLVDDLPGYGLCGLISFFATKHQQRLGDLAADTVVVREFTSHVPYSWIETSARQAPAGSGGMLSPRQSYIIGSYLTRSPYLPVAARLTLTELIIKELGYDAGPLSLAQRESYLASLMSGHLGALG